MRASRARTLPRPSAVRTAAIRTVTTPSERSDAARTKQDAELYRIAAYTGLRLGELLALRWEDVNLVDRRLVVHRAVSDRIEGPTKSWQARFVPLADSGGQAFGRLAEPRRLHRPRRLRVLLLVELAVPARDRVAWVQVVLPDGGVRVAGLDVRVEGVGRLRREG